MSIRHIREILVQGTIIFVSYILAIFIRFDIMKSQPAINLLSLQYLLIALVYSILIACTFEYTEVPRYDMHRTGGAFQMLLKNAIGCLLLLSFFYIARVIHFSRMALFLFWLISSCGLLVLRMTEYSIVARRRCKGKDNLNVLLIGDGELAEEYIRAVNDNKQYGIRIKGYIGNSDCLKTDLAGWFEPKDYPGQVINFLGSVLTDELLQDIQEIVIAEWDEENIQKILTQADKKGVKVNIMLPNGNLIRSESRIRSLGSSKQISLNEDREDSFGTIPVTGMFASTAMLLLLLITRWFDIGAVGNNVAAFGAYRNIMFASFGFFLFLKMKGNGILNNAKRMAVCWIVTVGIAVAYELLYKGMADFGSDLFIISVAVLGVGLVFMFLNLISQDEIAFWM